MNKSFFLASCALIFSTLLITKIFDTSEYASNILSNLYSKITEYKNQKQDFVSDNNLAATSSEYESDIADADLIAEAYANQSKLDLEIRKQLDTYAVEVQNTATKRMIPFSSENSSNEEPATSDNSEQNSTIPQPENIVITEKENSASENSKTNQVFQNTTDNSVDKQISDNISNDTNKEELTEIIKILNKIPAEDAAKILANMEFEKVKQLIKLMNQENVAKILNKMPNDWTDQVVKRVLFE